MAKAEQVTPTGLSEKSKIYVVKKKEEELQETLEQVREEARLLREKAQGEAEQILDNARVTVTEKEKQAFEEIAKGAENQVNEILDSRDDRVETINESAEHERDNAIKAGLTFLLSE